MEKELNNKKLDDKDLENVAGGMVYSRRRPRKIAANPNDPQDQDGQDVQDAPKPKQTGLLPN